MIVVYFALILLCQVFLQGCLIISNVAAATSFFAGLLVLLLAGIQTLLTVLMVAGFDVGAAGAPETVLGSILSMWFVTSIWSLIVGGLILVIVSCIPQALTITADQGVWTIIWQSALFGGAINGLLLPICRLRK